MNIDLSLTIISNKSTNAIGASRRGKHSVSVVKGTQETSAKAERVTCFVPLRHK